MKFLVFASLLLSLNALAESHMLLARCSGEYEGEEMKVNILVNEGYFCGKGNDSAQKGLIVVVDEFMSADDALVDFTAEKITIKDLQGFLEIKLADKGAPMSTTATVKMGIGEETETMELECDVPHYQMDCSEN